MLRLLSFRHEGRPLLSYKYVTSLVDGPILELNNAFTLSVTSCMI